MDVTVLEFRPLVGSHLTSPIQTHSINFPGSPMDVCPGQDLPSRPEIGVYYREHGKVADSP